MMRKCIDSEAFFKVINTLPYKDTSYPDAAAYNGAISDVADMLTHFPAADIEPRWIPVTERLPEEKGQYLVSGKWANKDEEVWICEFVRLCHIWGWCNEASRPVIQAWMPLPTPYIGGEEE